MLGSIQALGFVPKVVDSAPSSFNIDAEQVRARISKDVRCLLVTHAAGEPVDVPAIKKAINDDISDTDKSVMKRKIREKK